MALRKVSPAALGTRRWIIEQLLHVYDSNIRVRRAKVITGTALRVLASTRAWALVIDLKTTTRPIRERLRSRAELASRGVLE